MSWKRMQVLRVTRTTELKREGVTIPANTRVVVIHEDDSRPGSFLVKIADPLKPELAGRKVHIGSGKLRETFRGRPEGSTADAMMERKAAIRAAKKAARLAMKVEKATVLTPTVTDVEPETLQKVG